MLSGVVFPTWDRIIDLLAGGVIHQSECGPGVSNGSVTRAVDGLTSHYRGGTVEGPKALTIINFGIVGGLATEGGLVDVAKGVEGIGTVSIAGVVDGTEMGSEEFRLFRDVGLRDHVLDGGFYRMGRNGIDAAPCEAEETVADALPELRREGFGELDGLGLNGQAADIDVVGTNGAGGRGPVAIGDLPRGAGRFLESTRLSRVEDGMA